MTSLTFGEAISRDKEQQDNDRSVPCHCAAAIAPATSSPEHATFMALFGVAGHSRCRLIACPVHRVTCADILASVELLGFCAGLLSGSGGCAGRRPTDVGHLHGLRAVGGDWRSLYRDDAGSHLLRSQAEEQRSPYFLMAGMGRKRACGFDMQAITIRPPRRRSRPHRTCWCCGCGRRSP